VQFCWIALYFFYILTYTGLVICLSNQLPHCWIAVFARTTFTVNPDFTVGSIEKYPQKVEIKI
jgi:hypothetical protein